MIKSISISNYALIDRLEINLSPGLNIITGETGAGKSIMLGAMSLLLGSRADAKVVSDISKKSLVEAVFDIGDDETAKRFFADNDLDWNNDGTAIVRREISPGGRSRAFINDTPVTLAILEAFSKSLIDIHSQHQNLLLSNPEFQLRIIDAMAQDGGLLESYRECFSNYRRSLSAYNKAKKNFENARNREGELREKLKIIEDLKPKDGEQAELEKERELLENYTFVKESVQSIVNRLQDNEDSILDLLKHCNDDCEDIKELIPDGESLGERLSGAFYEIQDIARSFDLIDSDLNGDPQRLEYVEKRLDDIYRAEKKFGVESVEELIEIGDKLYDELQSYDNGTEIISELQKTAKENRSKVIEAAKILSQARQREADVFIKELEEKAMPLGMKNIKATVEFTYLNEFTENGIDKVDFKFAFNKNQEPLSISHTASGGEISRLMLCIKYILANKMQFPTIIFDEIDTGVSGEIADRMGSMMLDISSGIQVLAITHLPQVAAKGDTHFKVYKEDGDDRTFTRLQGLDSEERVKEIALMLSGSKVDDAALANAKSLLSQNR